MNKLNKFLWCIRIIQSLLEHFFLYDESHEGGDGLKNMINSSYEMGIKKSDKKSPYDL